MPRATTNAIIRTAARSALAYVPVAEHAAWYRGWRRTAREVTPATLKARLESHVQRMRLRSDPARVRGRVGDGTAGAVWRGKPKGFIEGRA